MTQVEIAPDTSKEPLEADYLANLGLDRLNLEPDTETPIPDAPVTETPVVPDAPVTEKPNRPEAAKRVQEKEWKKKAEELEAELATYRPYKDKAVELETSVTEFRTLAEQKEVERKSLEDAYRNEAGVVPDEVIYDLPQVKTALDTLQKNGATLFPRDLSDPNSDEPVRHFNLSNLSDVKKNEIEQRVSTWAKMQGDSNLDPDMRSDVQHVLISQMAAIAGVKPERFTTKIVNGSEYQVLPPSHPVYQHLSRSIEPFIDSRSAFDSALTTARASREDTLRETVQTKIRNTRQMWTDAGVGVTGEALTAALSRNPDSPTLQAMKLIEAHPDLVAELQQNAELEALTNGHLRPQLDLSETDPTERSAKARAHMARIGHRAINAPLTEPLKKLALRQSKEIGDLRAKLVLAEAEASKTRTQAEPGGVVGGEGALDAPVDDHYARIANRLKLG